MSTKFTFHDLETAPEGSKPLLKNVLASSGRIVDFYAVMAESPEALSGYSVEQSV